MTGSEWDEKYEHSSELQYSTDFYPGYSSILREGYHGIWSESGWDSRQEWHPRPDGTVSAAWDSCEQHYDSGDAAACWGRWDGSWRGTADEPLYSPEDIAMVLTPGLYSLFLAAADDER